MKQFVGLLCIYCLLFISCSEPAKEKKDAIKYKQYSNSFLDSLNQIKNDWQTDSLGCLRKRLSIIASGKLNYENFVGGHFKYIRYYLGKEAKCNTSKNGDKELNYYTECHYVYKDVKNEKGENLKGISGRDSMQPNTTEVNTEATYLSIRMDSDSIITSVTEPIP